VAAHNEAGYHLVARGYLVLKKYAGIGDGGRELGGRPFYAFAAGLLAGKQFIVADVVGGQHLVYFV
jgi:hypothetical protein